LELAFLAGCIVCLPFESPIFGQVSQGTAQLPNQFPVPEEARRVAELLRRMGRGDTANRFEADIRSGRASFGNLGGGVNGQTGANILWGNANTNTFNNEMRNQLRPNTPFRSPVLIGWALTVEHEYVHMDQSRPAQTPQFENKAWAHSLEVCQSWIRSVRSEMTRAGLEPDSPEKSARLRELQGIMEGLRAAHDDAINGIREGIQGGTIDPRGPWPNVDMTTTSDLDVAQRVTRDTANLYARNAGEDADSTDRRLRQQEKEKRIQEQRDKDQKAREEKAKAQAERERQEKEKQAKAKKTPPPPPPPATPQPPQTTSANTTVTKGQVISKDGSKIVDSETHDGNGKLISVTHTEYDKNGNKVGETVYDGGAGEGHPGDLKDGEANPPTTQVTVDAKPVLGAHLDGLDAKTVKKTTADFGTMDKSQKISKASKAGDKTLDEAKNTTEKGAKDSQKTTDDSTSEIAKGDAENSWNKALGDALQTGLAAGGAAFGTAVGGGLASQTTKAIFDKKHHDDKSGKGDGGSTDTESSGTTSSSSSSGKTSGSSKGHSSDSKSSLPPPPPGTNAPTTGTNATSTASGTNATTAGTTTATTAGTTTTTTPKGYKCPVCGSYNTTYAGTYYADGTAMYDCHGCGNRVHDVSGW
jgi:hypothetical protein